MVPSNSSLGKKSKTLSQKKNQMYSLTVLKARILVSPTDSKWEQGRYLPRLCKKTRFLALEVACIPQLVLPFLNDSRFLLPSLHFPPLSITCSALTRIQVSTSTPL